MTVISPTVGRVVWYTPPSGHVDHGDQPFAALVTYVHDDRLINLAFFDHDAHPGAATSVVLVQEGDPKPDSRYADWMPYQLGQAKKHEEPAAASKEPAKAKAKEPR